MSSIEVEVKVIGMFGGVSLAVSHRVSLPPGARVQGAVTALYEAGVIARPVWKTVKKLRPPLFLVINDEKVDAKGMAAPLADGDVVTIMQLMAGG